jgi:predicted dehydrogenase
MATTHTNPKAESASPGASQSIALPTRRSFIHSAAAFAALPLLPRFAPRLRLGPNQRLQLAKVAVGGMGESDLEQLASHPNVDVVALCDVDSQRRQELQAKFPKAKWFADWREMFDKLGGSFDAVSVSTPDHMHAPIAMSAMQKGKHVYCQKPLAHTAFENRALADFAKAHPKVVTQMGTQRSSMIGRRQQLQLLREGAIGKIRTIHAWSDRPMGWWPQGQPRPAGSDTPPEWLSWDLWLGVAPARPYVKDRYAPFKWRGTYDFGCGALGDMGCHIMDYPFLAAGLELPASVRCDCTDATDDEFPTKETITLKYAPNSRTAPEGVSVIWYDGGLRPTNAQLGIPDGVDIRSNAAVVIGDKGVMLCPLDPEHDPKDRAKVVLTDEPQVWDGGRNPVKLALPKLPERNHWHHWVEGCFGNAKPEAHFAFAGLLCESLSVGAAASRFPNRELQYDAKNFAFANEPAGASGLKSTYREGWSVPGLS